MSLADGWAGNSPSAVWPQSPIPTTVLASVVRLYEKHSYSVWPVVNAKALLQQLEDDDKGKDKDKDDDEDGRYDDENTYCLATALCAATMAQLNLAPLAEGDLLVDSSMLATESIRAREQNKYRENLDPRCILTSFFLHVYHAKINQRNSAMMFIHEAISGARLLKLDVDCDVGETWDPSDVVDNREVLFPLLWVSER